MSVKVKNSAITDGEKNYEPVCDANVAEDLPKFGVRHIQCIILFFCLMIAHGIRSSFSVAIVAMTSKSPSAVETFDWDKKTQDIILSSFFWGYVVMQLPAGQMAARFGGKRLIVVAITMNGVFALATPTFAYWAGWGGICACRTIIGLTQGMMVPGCHTLLGRWVPLQERGRLSAFVYGGGYLGVVIFMATSGLLADTRFGWPLIFYVQGSLGIFVGLIWTWFGRNSPAKHSTICEREKLYIQESLGQLGGKINHTVPWRKLLTSVPVWAICAAHAGQLWGHNTLTSEIPAYMSKVVHTNVKKSGTLTALPFLVMWVMISVFSFIFDTLVNRKICTATTARKLANTIGSWPVAVGLIAIAFVPVDNIVLLESLLIFTIGIKSASYLGYMINHMDLSPNHAGTIMSVTNFISNALTILAPITAGLILTDDTDVSLWRIVFYLTAAVYFFSNLVFMIYGSSIEVPWNHPERRNSEKDIKRGSLGKVEILLNDVLLIETVKN